MWSFLTVYKIYSNRLYAKYLKANFEMLLVFTFWMKYFVLQSWGHRNLQNVLVLAMEVNLKCSTSCFELNQEPFQITIPILNEAEEQQPPLEPVGLICIESPTVMFWLFLGMTYLHKIQISRRFTAWKVSRYKVFSSPYFPTFRLNTGKYGPEKTSYLYTFHAVIDWVTWHIAVSFV